MASAQSPAITDTVLITSSSTIPPEAFQPDTKEKAENTANGDTGVEAPEHNHDDSASEKGASKDVENDAGTGEPEHPATATQVSRKRRNKIVEEIRRRTGVEISEEALDGFLDTAQAIDLILKSITYEEPPTVQSETATRLTPREIAKPELKRMSWEEWRKTGLGKGDGTREHHSAIDILCEEPQPRWALGRSTLTKASRSSDSATTESGQNVQNKEDGLLPHRIRINSVPAKRILDSLCDDQLAFRNDTDPLIIFRPYKILIHKKDEIKAKMHELEQRYTDRLNMNESATCSTDLDRDTSGTSSREQSHSDTNIKEDDKNDEENADFLAKREFPQGMIFFTDTDWNILTFSEIKEAVDDFRCLVRFIDEIVQPARNYLRSQPPTVHFSNIWHLFPAGCLIYCRQSSTPQKIWRVIQATGGRRYMSRPDRTSAADTSDWTTRYSDFTLDCYYLDFDGINFIRVCHRFTIERFEKPMLIEALPVMPLADAEKRLSGVDREIFRERGKQFIDYTKPQYRYYEGFTVTHSPCGEPLCKLSEDGVTSQRLFTERVESQVVVDFERGIQANPGLGPVEEAAECCEIDDAELEDVMESAERDDVWDKVTTDILLRNEQAKQQRWSKGDAKPEGDDLLLLPDRIFGFILRTRRWACLRLSLNTAGGDRLSSIDRPEDSWNDLELPDGHKSVIQALISTHFSKDKNQETHFDLVREKGKGIIILLHGAPGVGKTATAECVAASYGKPLLPITCGDLGLKPKEVESTLYTAFQLAQAWDGIMLLDEADIFLAQRTTQDIERNALVSVFLRVLEYYEGVLFLTTNRVGAFDEAFKSRIHMALYYPPLDWPTTRKIWRNLIRRARQSPVKVDCDPEALVDFSQVLFEEQNKNKSPVGPAWNGRQIRNAFQSAIALARNENNEPGTNVMVKPSHFETVAKVSKEFNQYIFRVRKGRNDADFASEVGFRYDGFDRSSFAQGPSHQSQSLHFPPPSQTPMPMRQATPNGNHFQGFSPPQTMYQQPAHATTTGSPYNPTQPTLYNPTQPPPQFNLSSAYGTQQLQHAQQLPSPPVQQHRPHQFQASQQFQSSQASLAQQYHAPRIPPGQQFQQFQSSQNPQAQQYQTAEPHVSHAPQMQPGAPNTYVPTGIVEQVPAA